MQENESKNLANLRVAVNENFSLLQIGILLDCVSSHESIQACSICYETNRQEVREAANNYASKLRPEIIYDNLELLLNYQRSLSQNVRDFAKSKYELFNSQKLSENFTVLVAALGSNYTLVRFYAEELLIKIDPKDLFPRFNLLSDFYNAGPNCVRRIAKKMLIKTMHSFTAPLMLKHLSTIIEFQKSDDEDIKNLADWIYLTVVKCYWPFEKLSGELPFLIECRSSSSDMVSEVSASIFLAIAENWEIAKLSKDIDYLVTLQCFGENTIRRRSRDLSLKILEGYTPENLYKYRNFLIRCQESKFYSVRHQSNLLLAKIPISMYSNPADIKSLIDWHYNGYRFVGKTVKRILFKIPAENYLPLLDDLIVAQRSIDHEHRYLNEALALRINIKDLRSKAEDISVWLGSGYVNVANLARELSYIIS
ncbi:MAG: hypothetical protein ACOYL8_04655 [Patescibacteria group bacterium]